MPIPASPPAPTPDDVPADFNLKAFAMLAAWAASIDPMNQLEANVVAKEASTTAAAAVASAASAFKGTWSSLAGALNIPATVAHQGALWILLSNTADVGAITPGLSPQWQAITPPASIGGLIYMRDNYGAL